MSKSTKTGVVNTIAFGDEEFVTSSESKKVSRGCVAVARRENVIGLRHSRDPENNNTLEFNRVEWKAFIDGVKKGEFDI